MSDLINGIYQKKRMHDYTGADAWNLSAQILIQSEYYSEF